MTHSNLFLCCCLLLLISTRLLLLLLISTLVLLLDLTARDGKTKTKLISACAFKSSIEYWDAATPAAVVIAESLFLGTLPATLRCQYPSCNPMWSASLLQPIVAGITAATLLVSVIAATMNCQYQCCNQSDQHHCAATLLLSSIAAMSLLLQPYCLLYPCC